MKFDRFKIPEDAKWVRCKECQMEITFVKNKNNKFVPITRAGINHFIDCPKADTFRKTEWEDWV